MRKLPSILAVLAIALVGAGCGSKSSSSSTASSAPSTSPYGTSTSTTTTTPTATVKVSTATVAGLGTVLVNGQGHVLYVFAPDKHVKVTCTGSCAAVWPPLAGSSATVSGEAKQSLVSSDPNPSGGTVVTYAGWPLYTYVADTSAGVASGQALNINGGRWYVITPSGTLIEKKP